MAEAVINIWLFKGAHHYITCKDFEEITGVEGYQWMSYLCAPIEQTETVCTESEFSQIGAEDECVE